MSEMGSEAEFQTEALPRRSGRGLEAPAAAAGPAQAVQPPLVTWPRLEVAPAFLEVDLARYPNITAWLARLQAKPNWQDA